VRRERGPEHVVFVCGTYYPRVTGVGVVVDGWARRLIGRGIGATVVAPAHPRRSYYPPHRPPEGLEVVRLPSRPVPFAPGLRSMRPVGPHWNSLVARLKGKRVVVHGQDVLNAGSCALKLGARLMAPVVLHIHSPVFGREVEEWLPAAFPAFAVPAIHQAARRIAAANCAAADAVVAVTTFVAGLFGRKGISTCAGGRRPIQVLSCGVEAPDHDTLVPNVRGEYGIPSTAPLLLYVGRLDPDKGVMDVLEALVILRRRVPSVRLLVVGGGPLEPRYRRSAVRMGLGNSVQYAGWCQHQEVWSYYRQADALITGNADEAQGLMALEAQQCRLPVVGYRTGGIGLMVKDGVTGVLAEPEPAALAEAAVPVCTNPELRAHLGNAGPSNAARFSADANSAAVLDIYREVLLRARLAKSEP